MKITLYDPSEISFTKYIEENYSDLRALKRIFGLIRIFGCGTLVEQNSEWSSSCSDANCGNRNSGCVAHLDALKDYNVTFEKKRCTKLIFLKEKVNNVDSIGSASIIGYCIVHQDSFSKRDEPEIKVKKVYIAESYITPLSRRRNYQNLPPVEMEVTLNQTKMRGVGDFYCQENGITDSSAHSAIKIALKPYFPEINSQLIDQAAGIDSLRAGFTGLTPKEISDAISKITDFEVTPIANLFFNEDGKVFSRLIYFAINSGFPVIVLIPPSAAKLSRNDLGGIALPITGYSIDLNRWWPYDLNPISESPFHFLSSFSWCDNFIISDTHLGPSHMIPPQFFFNSSIKAKKLPKRILRLVSNISSKFLSIISSQSAAKIYALIVHPKQTGIIDSFAGLEKVSFELLKQFTNQIIEKEKKKGIFRRISKLLESGNIVLSSRICHKKIYIDHLKDDNVPINYIESCKETLPDWIGMVEFSSPELFTINSCKYGEMLFDPISWEILNKEGVIAARYGNTFFFRSDSKHILAEYEASNLFRPILRHSQIVFN